jgi:16S rRNA processing protein RimM
MTKGRVLLGVVAAPHGVRGLVRIRSFTEDPMAIASYGALSDETGQKRYRVEAEAARGLRLYVERSALPATGEREWYEADLVGLAAVDRDGQDWGKVLAFHDFGAGRAMEVSGGNASRSSVMLPFTDAVVPEIDVEGGKVVVDPPAGVLAGGESKEA